MLFNRTDYVPLLALLSLLAGSASVAETEIHRCAQEDGTVAFQETPCEEDREALDDSNEPAAPAASDDFFDCVNPFDQPPESETETETALVSEDRAECEKTTRDAIDAIDLEMRETSYSKEQGDEYLAALLQLTRQLRACKAL